MVAFLDKAAGQRPVTLRKTKHIKAGFSKKII